MIKLKDPIKMSKVGKKTNPPIPFGHEDYHPILIRGWKPLSVSLGIRILILNSIRGSNYSRFPLIHEGWRGHWLEGRTFTTSIGQGKQTQRRVMGSFGVGESFYLVFLGKEENKCLRGIIVCYVWKNVVHGNKWCVNEEHGKKLCVVNSRNGVHGIISMNKPLDFFTKIVIPLKSIIEFVLNFKKN